MDFLNGYSHSKPLGDLTWRTLGSQERHRIICLLTSTSVEFLIQTQGTVTLIFLCKIFPDLRQERF